jgi:hypothetical protein
MANSEPEISIFGELAALYRDSLKSDIPVKAGFNFGENLSKRRDFDQLSDLIEQDKITMEGLYYLYSIAMKFMRQALERLGDQGENNLLGKETKRVVMTSIPVILGAKLALFDGDEKAAKDFTPMIDSILNLMFTDEGFVLKVVDRAFNDAVVMHIRESVRMEVKDGESN